jgi:hypothetical protein
MVTLNLPCPRWAGTDRTLRGCYRQLSIYSAWVSSGQWARPTLNDRNRRVRAAPNFARANVRFRDRRRCRRMADMGAIQPWAPRTSGFH